MIKNHAYYKPYASIEVPDPSIGYWIDLQADPKGNIIKFYDHNIHRWAKLTDASSEYAVAPYIGNNGNWWVENRDTGIDAKGKSPYIYDDYWYVWDPNLKAYVVTDVIAKGQSAYDIAVKLGYSGTEQEWVDSLSADSKEAAKTALEAAAKAEEAVANLDDAADEANEQANRAKEYADNPPKIVNNIWYTYDETTKDYVSTGIRAIGDPFTIKKTYGSIVDMEDDYDTEDVEIGQFVWINTGDVEDPDDSKLYLKGDAEWTLVGDLSGQQGIQGMSAYDVAVQLGYVGTEDEWIQSIKQPALDAADAANTATNQVLATEAAVKAAEEARVTAEEEREDAEDIRESNEATRIANEAARVAAENSRVSAENARVSAEEARAAAETTRISNEAKRESNEDERVEAEATRQANEAARITTENTRATAESARAEAEAARATAEDERVSNETTRVNSESERVKNEATRQANEAVRETQEAERESNTTAAIEAVNKAKTAAETATTAANTAAEYAQEQGDRAAAYTNNPPTIISDYWYVWDADTEAYVNTGTEATGEPGKTPIIQDGTWWIYDNETSSYTNTNISVSSTYELTKAKVENALTGDITSHNHDTTYLSKTNTEAYTPTGDYNPATKKYVDDAIGNVDLSELENLVNDATTALTTKVDKVEGKDLSTNDYTDVDKAKVAGIEEGAQVNVIESVTYGDTVLTVTNKNVTIPEYELPTATTTVKGGVIVGSGLVMNGDVLSATGGGTADAVDWSNITNMPDFATVATTGDYTDLVNTPTVDVNKAYVDAQIDAVNAALANKANVETGKGLSTNDYTDTDKSVVDTLADDLNVTVLYDTVTTSKSSTNNTLTFKRWNLTSGAADNITSTISLADSTNAGLMSPEEKTKLANLDTSISDQVEELSNTVTEQLATKADANTVYTKEEVDAKVSSVYRYCGTVSTYDSLPTTGLTIGDVYNVEDTGANYAVLTTDPVAWDKLSETIDLTPYLTKSDAASTYLTQTDASSTYQAKGDYLTSVPDEYVTETELTAKDYITTSTVNTKLSNYYTKTETSSEIETAVASKLDSSEYNASDVLTKLKTVDGTGSGLDADTVDGIEASAFALKTDIPDTITVDDAMSDTSTNPVQNKVINAAILDADEVYISSGVEPTGNQEVWIDLSEDPADALKLLTDAPSDGKIYGRQDGAWVEVEVDMTETLNITLTGNQAQPDVSLNGVTVSVSYSEQTNTYTWDGTTITAEIPVNNTYTITSSDVDGYSNSHTSGNTYTYTALAGNTRTVEIVYNTTVTTFEITSNQDSSDFVTASAITIQSTTESEYSFTKELTGSLSYTVNIPTGCIYTVTYASISGFSLPETNGTEITATGVTQSVSAEYKATKLTIAVTSSGSDSSSMTAQVTINGETIEVTDTVTKLMPYGQSYTVTPLAVTNYILNSEAVTFVANTTSKTIEFSYTFLSEDAYAFWVIFDDTTSTTELETGGNEDVKTEFFSKFRRCLAKPQSDGTAAITYLSDTDSRYYADGTEVNSTITGGSSVDNANFNYWMVHFPKYYYYVENTGTDIWKYYFSLKQLNHATDGTEDYYKEERECLVGMFEGTTGTWGSTTKLVSAPYVSSTGSLTIVNFSTYAQNNGSNWGLIDYRVHKTIANLFCAKYGNTNISTSNSSIPCSGGTRRYNYGTNGGTLSLGNSDGKSTVPSDTSYYSTSFLGIEDCYYGKAEFVQGLNIGCDGTDYQWVVYDGGCSPGSTTAELEAAGYTNIRTIGVSTADGSSYISKISHGEYGDVMPTVAAGSSTTYYADKYWRGPGSRVFQRSESSVYSAASGVFASTADSSSSVTDATIGSRLSFYGEIVEKTREEFSALSVNYNG